MRECINCVMNTLVDENLTFDSDGLCNHCIRYKNILGIRTAAGGHDKAALDGLVAKIKKSGIGKNYDCLIGVSGGVDSTYVAYLTRQLGLRPLAVHLDNGWNSEASVKNIENILRKLEIDLVTIVLDWEEFRDLQIAFLKSSTPDGEIPTDHAIFAVLWKEAVRNKIKYIISGMNFATESMSVPNWAYGHSDYRYIRDVYKRFGRIKGLRNYPHFTPFYLFYANFIRGVRTVSVLNYIDYKKESAKQVITEKLNWKDYGGKHHESIYTRFFQGYILPRKFKIDKRFAHLSDLINAGQLTKNEAYACLKTPPYPVELQQEDYSYVIKKLGLSISEFEQIMSFPTKTFSDYKNIFSVVMFMKHVVNWMRKYGIYPK